METLFNFHELLQIRLRAPEGEFRDYCELEFDHGRPAKNVDIDPRMPTLNVSVSVPLATSGNVWALGKGLFYNEDTQEVLVSRDRGTSFFEAKDIYASLTCVHNRSLLELSVKVNPEVFDTKGVDAFFREMYRRFVKLDPRSHARTQAEIFVSQFLEPNIYRIFLNGGHLLVHAAALERGGHGTLIFGPQNVGKTTVTIGLAKRGWKMLGDDLCLIDDAARLLSYAKPLKLERELLKSSPDAYRVAAKELNKRDSALVAFRPRFRRAASNMEVKVPPSALGIEVIERSVANTAFFLQRATNTGSDKVRVEKLSTQDAVTLCEQHIAAEYDVNKHLDRDIRQNLALHFRTAGGLSMVTPEASAIIRKSFSKIDAYMITMSKPGADAVETIEQLTAGVDQE